MITDAAVEEPTAKRLKVTALKNEYFTYTESNGVASRPSEQLWNVTFEGKSLTIYLEARALKAHGFSFDATYFGRKHMMTFAGGKAAGAGGNALDKMKRSTGKRQTHVPTSQKKKWNDPNKRGNVPASLTKYAKYGIFGQNGKGNNTIIFCDAVSLAELQAAFAKALLAAGDGPAAIVRLPGSAVYDIANSTSTPTKSVADDKEILVEVHFEKVSGKSVYALRHLEGHAPA